jgi:molybdenum-dependent DNA-binding transcriptional regulator ModE
MQPASFSTLSMRQMRAFAAVARAGSFTAAARQINLTQSAVSMLVQQLEETLGLKLFDRGVVVSLTAAGQQLLPLARRILDDLQQIVDGASDFARCAPACCAWWRRRCWHAPGWPPCSANSSGRIPMSASASPTPWRTKW